MSGQKTSKLHLIMYPWFAMGHLTPFLHLSNKLAGKGHRISFLVPTNTQSKLQHLNLHPDLITFVSLTVPHVEGLPFGAETMSDVPIPMAPILATAMDLMQNEVELLIKSLSPDFIFFDFADWIPSFSRNHGYKSIFYSVIYAAPLAYFFVPSFHVQKNHHFTESELMQAPPGYPSLSLQPRLFEARTCLFISLEFGSSGRTFHERILTSMSQSDAISFRSCREIEKPYCDYLESQYKKPTLLAGPLLPDPPNCPLDESWDKWLSGFKERSVLYCALGSECILQKDQFRELVIGLELTGLPFLAVLKPPFGTHTLEEGLPDGFEERVKGRGVVHGGWVQQLHILKHPSLGCFVSHGGPGSMWESLVSDCQIVLLPHLIDQFTATKIMCRELKVAVEIERREEDGWFTREGVCRAVQLVMNEGSKVGIEVKSNHAKLKNVLLGEEFEPSYLESFNSKLEDLLH